MKMMNSCPDDETLCRFSLGQLSEVDAEIIEAHLKSCDACVMALGQAPVADALTAAVRAHALAASPFEDEPVSELMRQLEKQPPVGLSRVEATAELSAALTPTSEETIGAVAAATMPGAERYDFLASAQKADEIGRLGPYRVLEVLGSGGMGVVFRAENIHLDRTVALKIMLQTTEATVSARERFLREARTAASIEHDHVVTIYQVGEDHGVPYLAMQMLKGESLDSRLQREGKLPIAEVLRIGRETALGLAAAHERGLVHRDIKPANLWLEGERGRIKILDFGLARAAGDGVHLTQSGVIVGTPAFMAPEQSRGTGVDHRADLFSLGCVLYRCCTGQLPFSGTDTMSILASLALDDPTPPRQLDSEVPSGLSKLVMKLLAKDPAERPASARAVIESLTALETGESRERSGERDVTTTLDVLSAKAPRNRRRGLLALAAVVLLAVLGPLAYFCAPTAIRIATNKGQLVIESDDPDVEVRIKQNGELVTLVDAKTNKDITLRAGTYKLELVGGKDGLTLSTNQFTLRRGSREVVKVRWAAKNTPAALGDEIRHFSWNSSDRKTGRQQGDDVYGVAVSRDGRVFTNGLDGFLRCWNLATGKERKRWRMGIVVTHVSLTPDQRHVLYGVIKTGWIGFVLFDSHTEKEVQRFPGRETWPSNAVFSPDGRRLITTGEGSRLVVWDVATGARLRTITTPLWVTRMAASADFRWALSCSQWRTDAWLWDIASGKAGPTLVGHRDGVTAVALSPDGRHALTGSKDKTMRLWDVKSGKELRCFAGHTDTVFSVAFSPDGRRILSGSADHTVRLWDIESGKQVHCFKGHTDKITTLLFTPDGRRAFSASADQSVRFWRLPNPDLGKARGRRELP